MQEAEFEKWATKAGLSTDTLSGKYFSEETRVAYVGWCAAIRMMGDTVLHDYGICQQCFTHFVDMGLQEDGGRAMECVCSVDGYRDTKIIKLMGEANGKS